MTKYKITLVGSDQVEVDAAGVFVDSDWIIFNSNPNGNTPHTAVGIFPKDRVISVVSV